MIKGIYITEHYREGRLIGTYVIDNMITMPCLNAMLDGLFNVIAPSTGNVSGYSYCSLIDSINFIATNKFDLLYYHPGWSEFIGYSGDARAVNTSGVAVTYVTSGGIPNAYQINMGNYSLEFNENGVIVGLFITNNPIPDCDGESGLLISTAIYPTPIICTANDILNITYNVYMNPQPQWVEDRRP